VKYPNGVVHGYSYDAKNRLTNLAAAGGAGAAPANFGYAYTLDNAGHRTSVTEKSGRTVNYAYDNIYRLTSEAIAGDPAANNGVVGYVYDPVGNRTQVTSTLAAIPAGGVGYDADDRLTSDAYDANGNTVNSGGLTSVYDFENHLIQEGGATMVYDGDGNRVKKTVGGVTTKYLVDTLNPTGYAQVVYESIQGPGSNSETRNYTYGLDRISQTRNFSSGATQTSYYVHDGHGSTRALTDQTGNVTDTYDYDAFGNEIHSTGATPNEFLFAGEQDDATLNLFLAKTLTDHRISNLLHRPTVIQI
jgi:YD repeat-containing protein